jgi:hypothetical protein
MLIPYGKKSFFLFFMNIHALRAKFFGMCIKKNIVIVRMALTIKEYKKQKDETVSKLFSF